MKKFDNIKETDKVDLSKFKKLRSGNIVLTKFCGIPPSKRAKLARLSSNAKSRGEKSEYGRFTIVNRRDKRQLRERYVKYPEVSKHMTQFILEGWYSGSPVSKQAC